MVEESITMTLSGPVCGQSYILSPLSSPLSDSIPGLPDLLHLYDTDPVPGEIPGGLQPPPQGNDQIKSSGFQPLINSLSMMCQILTNKNYSDEIKEIVLLSCYSRDTLKSEVTSKLI